MASNTLKYRLKRQTWYLEDLNAERICDIPRERTLRPLSVDHDLSVENP